MIITNDGKIYRVIELPGDRLRYGEWEMLFNGQWQKVRNYEIRKKLTEILNIKH
jgi:hypothetical protein